MEGLRINMRTWVLFAALAALVLPVRADFSYEQISQITGGSMLRMMKMVPGGGKATQPQSSRILLKGNRLATVAAESISIIDLDAETMTNINVKDKQYSVITFAEYKQAMAAMAEKMSQGKPDGGQAAEMEFSVKVDPTGQTRTIEGMSTKQFIMTLTTGVKDQKSGQTVNMDMVSDMWMAPGIAGYEQIQRFYVRMAEKMNWVPGMMSNPMMMGQKGYSEGMAKMVKEASKLEGVPVLQVTTMQGMGGMPGGPGMPEMPNVGDAASASARRSAGNTTTSQASRAAGGGRFGGLAGAAAGGIMGGLGRKKKAEEAPAEQAQAPAEPAKPTPLMEMTVQSRDFSAAAVDASQFAIPAGFKLVEHEMKKALK